MSDINVKFRWSESSYLNERLKKDETISLQLFENLIVKATTLHGNDIGYDKTSFQLECNSNTYTGRIDIGKDTQGTLDPVKRHVTRFCKYCLNNRDVESLSESDIVGILFWHKLFTE